MAGTDRGRLDDGDDADAGFVIQGNHQAWPPSGTAGRLRGGGQGHLEEKLLDIGAGRDIVPVAEEKAVEDQPGIGKVRFGETLETEGVETRAEIGANEESEADAGAERDAQCREAVAERAPVDAEPTADLADVYVGATLERERGRP